MPGDPLAGRLLVAAPQLRGQDFFGRSVVLMLAYGDEGAIGLILNRPSDTDLGEAIPEWGEQAAEPQVVFVGGPVEPQSAICLARTPFDRGTESWQPLFDRLGTLDLTRPPGEVGIPVERIRVFLGHAGWGAGQLEDEIAAGMWFVVDAEPSDAMSPAPATLWHDVLHRQGGMLAAVASFPIDLSIN
jgi:putative transcriptional regulator